MGVRFNKRVNILPWLKVNVGKSGLSLTIGPKGKTLNIGSTGVNVNVSLGKGVGYSKRLITWKKLNLLSWIGLGSASVTKKKGKGSKVTSQGKKGTTKVPTLDEAIAEAEAEQQNTVPAAGQETNEQPGCSWGCLLGALAIVVILVLAAIVAYLLFISPSQ